MQDSAWTGLKIGDIVPDVPGGERLEAFVSYCGRQFEGRAWHLLSPTLMAERLAQSFRHYFQLPTPLRPSLLDLLQDLDMAVIYHHESADVVLFDCDTTTGQWQLHLSADLGTRQSIRALQGVFQILFWRCSYRLPWWNAWRELTATANPRRMADAFAYAVAMPPDALRDRAKVFGLNIWEMANSLCVTPSACFYGLRRYVRFEFPYFLARLDFTPTLDQQQFFFDARAVRARVWSKFLARPAGGGDEQTPALDALARFPRQNRVVEVRSYPYRAVKFRQPLIWTANHLFDLQLPQPTCFVARPNSQGTQLLLQAVPMGAHHFLMDRALHLQQEQARLQQRPFTGGGKTLS